MPSSRDDRDWFPFRPHVPVLEFSRCDATTLRDALDTHGIVAVSDVLPATYCDTVATQMAAWLGSRGVDAQDPKTWSRYTNKHFEMSPTILGMMNTGEIRGAPFVTDTRRRPEVRRLFEQIHGTPDLEMEEGGVFWGFAPEHYPNGRIPKHRYGGFENATDMWMHTDRGRDFTEATRFMSLIMMEDAEMHDHSFVYLENSHRYHDEYLRDRPKLEMEEPGDNFIQLGFRDTTWFERKGCLWRKVVAPKGSVIVWNDRLMHSTCFPSHGRPRPKGRFVVYGGWSPSK